MAQEPSYTIEFGKCRLCMKEKLEIMMLIKEKPRRALNKRTMLMSKCRHRAKHLLGNIYGRDDGVIHEVAEDVEGRQEEPRVDVGDTVELLQPSRGLWRPTGGSSG